MGPIRCKRAKLEYIDPTASPLVFAGYIPKFVDETVRRPVLAGTNPHLHWCLIATPSQDAARYVTGEVGRCGKASLCLSLRRRDWAVWLGLPQAIIHGHSWPLNHEITGKPIFASIGFWVPIFSEKARYGSILLTLICCFKGIA